MPHSRTARLLPIKKQTHKPKFFGPLAVSANVSLQNILSKVRMITRRQLLTSARRAANASRASSSLSRPTSNLVSRTLIASSPGLASIRGLPSTAVRYYANGRPHPPGGTHRMNLCGEDEKPALEQYGVDLTARAKEGKLDPVIGRDAEIQRTIQVLSRRTKNNPVLIGQAGTGRTAILEGLALS